MTSPVHTEPTNAKASWQGFTTQYPTHGDGFDAASIQVSANNSKQEFVVFLF
jgi:hypothetical protein